MAYKLYPPAPANGFDFLAAQQWNGRIAVVAQEASS